MQKLLSLVLVLGMVAAINVGCSSKGKDGEERELLKQYTVVDAEYAALPGWIAEPQAWAEREDSDDYKTYRYFVSTSEMAASKRLCQKSSEAQAAAKIAGEITQFIKNSYAQSLQGAQDEEVTSYMEDTLAQEIQSFLVGVVQHRTYWEERKYTKELGASENKGGFVCSALLKVKKETIEKSIERAMKKLFSSVTTNPDSKTKAVEALKDVEKKF
ncbi:MAG: hypothetical protein A2504_02980 [Bdellovibrionales bacterium RIFOXYD12_FULL_39_22]|nr:MAG: hypothetical protein A2385_05695 [Bdellovibrionales bacterium RIFOXYB1_FULL_39_21]OFZ42246.1 MAG: hypothetical protein A2485_15725 [Bdellovibrionales bacterium RIFOXYC12_FULL_39_17]OFZ46662.1 MAG: hypothetical protein A2404_03945 [Bdellovibrionales bacterium RIFOXYC1_FULL_39_130]OFZ76061.1 MAG: hypothetical protein A2560_03205 [Bdellovibrionales bacterium RIFOXYD1_FULL_39_84]OFZ93045.1 MAG: hypothetical protein A2504_02980 [Bdellovibrionales bacterium RIFOXYD12_FULL_39_22]HLE09939.1 hy